MIIYVSLGASRLCMFLNMRDLSLDPKMCVFGQDEFGYSYDMVEEKY